jgi:hypothetical protein
MSTTLGSRSGTRCPTATCPVYAPGIPFVGVLVTPILRCEPAARTITTDAGKEISLLALVPPHPTKLDLKLTRGTDALTETFDRLGVNEFLEPARLARQRVRPPPCGAEELRVRHLVGVVATHVHSRPKHMRPPTHSDAVVRSSAI